MDGGRLTMREEFLALPAPVSAGLTSLLASAPVAVVLAVLTRSLAFSVGVWVSAASVMCAALLAASAFRARLPRGIGYDDRRVVVRAVGRGEEPTEPRLADAVIEYAQSVQRRSAMSPQAKLVFGTALVVLGAVKVIGGRPLWAVSEALLLFGLATMGRAERRIIARAACAEQAAERLRRHG